MSAGRPRWDLSPWWGGRGHRSHGSRVSGVSQLRGASSRSTFSRAWHQGCPLATSAHSLCLPHMEATPILPVHTVLRDLFSCVSGPHPEMVSPSCFLTRKLHFRRALELQKERKPSAIPCTQHGTVQDAHLPWSEPLSSCLGHNTWHPHLTEESLFWLTFQPSVCQLQRRNSTEEGPGRGELLMACSSGSREREGRSGRGRETLQATLPGTTTYQTIS